MSTIWGFDHIKDKHTLCRGKDEGYDKGFHFFKRTRENNN